MRNGRKIFRLTCIKPYVSETKRCSETAADFCTPEQENINKDVDETHKNKPPLNKCDVHHVMILKEDPHTTDAKKSDDDFDLGKEPRKVTVKKG